MSKPKILTMFDETAEGSIYSKLNNPVTTTVIDRSLIVSGITDAHNNSIVTFKPGCDSSDVDSITINGDVYTIQDSLGNVVTGNTGMWINGATISVALDTTNKAAYILNNNYSTVAEPEIFIATYDVTTFPEIKAAYDAGKLLMLKVYDQLLASLNCVYCDESGQLVYVKFILTDTTIVNNDAKTVVQEFHIGVDEGWSDMGYTNASLSGVSAFILPASYWSGDTAPYTCTLAITGVGTSSNQEFLPGIDITEEQLTALQAANIQDGGQSTDSVTLKAFGEKPTIDIPIRVILRGDA